MEAGRSGSSVGCPVGTRAQEAGGTLCSPHPETELLREKLNLLPDCRGLDGGPQRCSHPEPVNVPLCGKRIFADVFKLRILG